MTNEDKGIIMRAIGTLEGTVKTGFENMVTGFKGSHARQDTANDRTGKLENGLIQVRLENEKQEIDLKWLKKSYWTLLSIGIPSVIAILIKLFTL